MRFQEGFNKEFEIPGILSGKLHKTNPGKKAWWKKAWSVLEKMGKKPGVIL